MNKIFDKIVFSNIPPSNKNVLWIYPIDSKHYDLRLYTIVQEDEYTCIKKWTSIGITDISKTDLTTDSWYVGIPYIYNSELPVYNEYENDLSIIDIDTDILLLIMSEYIPGQTTKYQFDTKNIYFDTRCLEPVDGHAEYIIVIPKHYKISSIYKENYYEETKSYKEDVLVEGNYKIEKDVEYNGNTYTVITLQFKDVYTPFQITTNVVRDLEIKDFIVQETGNSLDKVMSQQSVSKILEEIKTTIDNLPKESLITQELGTDSNKVISQKVVTDELNNINEEITDINNKIVGINSEISNKVDKLSLEEVISNKLSIVELSHLELIRTDTEDICFTGELGTVLDNFDLNSLKNHTLRLNFSDSILYDSKINNTIYLKDIIYLYLDFNSFNIAGGAKEYYFRATVSNLNLKYENGNDYKKYSTALITLFCDVNAKTCKLSFEDNNGFDKIVVNNQKTDTHCELNGFNVSVLPNNSKFHGLGSSMEYHQLFLGSILGEGLTIRTNVSNNTNSKDPIESATISRNGLDGVAREGIKFTNGKIKFYYDIDDGEELPINVTGIADPTTEFDAVNKKYIDLNFAKKLNTIVYDNIGQSLTNDLLVLLDNTQTVILNPLDENIDFMVTIGENTSLILNIGESVPSIGYQRILWLKPPYLEPNSTYIFNFEVIRGTSPQGQNITQRLGMWSKAEFV